jgi:hypothetical protein
MFTARQYRAKATEYCNLMKIANSPDELREYQQLERSFTELADNAQWAADNYNKTEHATASIALGPSATRASVCQSQSDDVLTAG